VIISIDKVSGELISGPDMITRGLIYNNEVATLVGDAKEVIKDTLKEMDLKASDEGEIKNQVKRKLFNFFYKKMGRRPIVLTVLSSDE
jgi:ribonuclease J